MLRQINKRQVLTLVIGGSVAVFLSFGFFQSVPVWVEVTLLFTIVYISYLTLRLAWIMAAPRDHSVSLKSRASAAKEKGLCCVCKKNPQGSRTLIVGYRKPTERALNFQIVDALYFGEGLADDIQVSVPICDDCFRKYMFLSKLRFFSLLGLDRSFRVLQKKPGYVRGLRYPFDPGNIGTAE